MTAGDIREVTVNHPSIGTRVWYPKAGTDSTFDPGGFRNDDNDDGVDGGGRMITQKNRKRWSAEMTLGWDMNTTNELDAVDAISESADPATFTIQHVNGSVWGGKGTVVGDVKGNGNTGELPIKIAGGGKLKKIAG